MDWGDVSGDFVTQCIHAGTYHLHTTASAGASEDLEAYPCPR